MLNQILISVSVFLLYFLGLFLQRQLLYSDEEIRNIIEKIPEFKTPEFCKTPDGKYWILENSSHLKVVPCGNEYYRYIHYIHIDSLNLTTKEKKFLYKWADRKKKGGGIK